MVHSSKQIKICLHKSCNYGAVKHTGSKNCNFFELCRPHNCSMFRFMLIEHFFLCQPTSYKCSSYKCSSNVRLHPFCASYFSYIRSSYVCSSYVRLLFVLTSLLHPFRGWAFIEKLYQLLSWVIYTQ